MATSSSSYTQRVSNLKQRLKEPETRAGTIAVLALGLLPVVLLIYFLVLLIQIPSVEGLSQERFEEATVVYAANGAEITRFYDQNRQWVPLDAIAEPAVQALIATEDRRFYEHYGVDIMRTGGAILQTLSGDAQGGSTITMQLVRNLFKEVNDDWVLTRKFKEWLTALKLEQRYSKKQILELYLNSVPFNYNAYGVEAAAQTYFNKPADDLDTLQSATLIGMLKGTSLYNPIQNPEQSRERRNVVLEQLREFGYLSDAAFERLHTQETETDFNPVSATSEMAPYFAAYVRNWLSGWADENGYNLYTAGLHIWTPLDVETQRQAEEALKEELEGLQAVVDVSWSRENNPYFSEGISAYQRFRQRIDEPFAYFWDANPQVLDALIQNSDRFQQLTSEQDLREAEALQRLRGNTAFVDSLKEYHEQLQAGLVAMNPNNGHVKAWVGGRDYDRYKYDHVGQAKRQPGSTFKPFVYAAALENGYHQNSLLRDEQVSYRDPNTGKVWEPENFSAETGRRLPLHEALAESKNTITAQLMLELGAARVADYARRMGIESELNEVPSLGLGTSPVTLLEMVTAYATLANQGRRSKPVVVTRIENRDGRVLYTATSQPEQAIPAATAYGTLNMMREVVEDGTGVRIREQYDAQGDLAAKTGTTQDNADGWFILIHPDLVIGSWVGFNSPALTFRTRYWGQGSHNALRVVGAFYRRARLPTSATFVRPASYVEPPPVDTTRRDSAEQDSFDDLFANDEDEAERVDTIEADESFTDPDAENDYPDLEPEGMEEDEAAPDEAAPDEAAPDTQRAVTRSEEEPEPLSPADSLTRQAREQSNVGGLLERQERADEDNSAPDSVQVW